MSLLSRLLKEAEAQRKSAAIAEDERWSDLKREYTEMAKLLEDAANEITRLKNSMRTTWSNGRSVLKMYDVEWVTRADLMKATKRVLDLEYELAKLKGVP